MHIVGRQSALVIIGLMLPSVASAATKSKGEKTAKAWAQARQEGGAKVFQSNSVRYHFLHSPHINDDAIVIEIQQNTTESSQVESIRGSIEVQAIQLQGNATPKKLWSIRDQADQAYPYRDPNLLITITDGCCGGSDAARVYSLDNGAYLFPFSDPMDKKPILVQATWTREDDYRMLGYIDAYWSARDRPTWHDADDKKWQLWGVLSYASRSGTIAKVGVFRERWDDPGNAPTELYLSDDAIVMSKPGIRPYDKTNALLRLDGPSRGDTVIEAKIFDKLSVHMTFEAGEGEIVVPISSDNFDLKAAKAPKNYKLMAMPGKIWKQVQQ